MKIAQKAAQTAQQGAKAGSKPHKAGKQAKNGTTGPSVKLSSLGLESFKMVELERSAIKDAPYNPRVINDAERRKLKGGVQRHGLVTPITWNKRTGNCVGGHQRLGVLDSLAKTKNYTLQVAEIDVDLAHEKELNVLLNNPDSQGSWDLDKLRDILSDKAIDLSGAGFDDADLFYLFGEDPREAKDASALGAMADRLHKWRDNYEKMITQVSTKGREDYYLVVVFRDFADRKDFLDSAKLPDNRYQSGVELRRIAGLDVSDMVEPQLPTESKRSSKQPRPPKQ